MTDTCYHAQLFSLEMGSHQPFSFAWASLEPQPSWSQSSAQLGWQAHCRVPQYWLRCVLGCPLEVFAQAGLKQWSFRSQLPK
jgi:hypothetical protein